MMHQGGSYSLESLDDGDRAEVLNLDGTLVGLGTVKRAGPITTSVLVDGEKLPRTVFNNFVRRPR